MSLGEIAKVEARRALRVLKSFMKGVRVSYHELDVSLPIEAEAGSADSGKLELDLPSLLVAVGQAALAAKTAVVILIDEVQYLSSEEFSSFILAIHRVNQLTLPVLLVGAGLPQIPGLAGEAASYSERLFSYPSVGALAEEDAVLAVKKPAEAEGAEVTQEVIFELLHIMEKYPYFIQQWAYDSWNAAKNDLIMLEDVRLATPTSIAALDGDFFLTRYQRCNNSEKKYMRALAELGPGIQKSADIAGRLGRNTTSKGPTRDSLIKKALSMLRSMGNYALQCQCLINT